MFLKYDLIGIVMSMLMMEMMIDNYECDIYYDDEHEGDFG